MEDVLWKVEGEAMAYPWVTIVFPRPPGHSPIPI